MMILTSVAEIISSREKKDGILLYFFTLSLFSYIFNGASNECTQSFKGSIILSHSVTSCQKPTGYY